MTNSSKLIDEKHYEAQFSECVSAKSHAVTITSVSKDIRKQVVDSLAAVFAGDPAKMDFLYRQLISQEKADNAPFDFTQMVQQEFSDDESTDIDKISNLCNRVISAILDAFHVFDDQSAALMQLIGLVNYCIKGYEQYLQQKRNKAAVFQSSSQLQEALKNNNNIPMPFKVRHLKP